MHRSALALAVLLVPVTLGAQPAREKLLRDIRHDDEAVRPAFARLTPAELKTQTTAGLLEIDDGVMIVQSIEVELPKGDNFQYGAVEFEPPVVLDSRGRTVPIERQSGTINATRNSVEHRLLAPGGEAAAQFASVKGRVTVQVPLTVETRTIRNGDRSALTKLGAIIDGPFVHYRWEPVGIISWMSDLEPVRAYDADGKALEREGMYTDSVQGDGFHTAAFYGAPATVEIDVPGELATVTIDYDLTLGDRRASKITKNLAEGEPGSDDPLDDASADGPGGLSDPSIDAEQLLAAAVNGDTKTVSRLLDAGMPPDARGASGMTALHVAAATGETEVLDLLLAAGADVNAPDAHGLTPLFGLVTDCENTAIVERLIAKGADVNAKGKSSMSALAMAKAMNCSEIVTALTKAGAR
jgi:hypothetical protein